MPFDTAILDGDFCPMNHKTVQPIGAKALKVYDETGREIEGFHHIVRGDSGATIRVAPSSYPLIQNDYVVDLIETALKKSRLDLTDGRFGVDYSHDGARMFAQWLLPAHTARIRDGVEATLRVIALNSYDASTALHGRIGNFNWACANQAVQRQGVLLVQIPPHRRLDRRRSGDRDRQAHTRRRRTCRGGAAVGEMARGQGQRQAGAAGSLGAAEGHRVPGRQSGPRVAQGARRGPGAGRRQSVLFVERADRVVVEASATAKTSSPATGTGN